MFHFLKYNYSLVKYNYNLVKYNHSLVEYNHSSVKYNHSLVEYNHNLVKYNHSLVEYNHSLVKYNHSLVKYNHSLVIRPKVVHCVTVFYMQYVLLWIHILVICVFMLSRSPVFRDYYMVLQDESLIHLNLLTTNICYASDVMSVYTLHMPSKT